MSRLINADALMDDIRKHSESYFADDFAHICVDKQPTVDAQPVRHGHWVGVDDEPYEVWECDVCGFIYETDSKLHRYCPNCGADMRGEKE
jgi:rubrerythrin